jgi:hydrogenase nickel incorporation protein HypA/HybF
LTPSRAAVSPCGETVALSALGQPCPACGSFQLSITEGDAMRVKEIEIG